MASKIAEAYVQIVPRIDGVAASINKQLGPGMEQAGVAGGTAMGGGMLSSVKKFIGPMAAAFGAVSVVNFGKDMIQAALEGQKVDAVLGKVASSMNLFGSQTGTVVTRLQDVATAQIKLTGIDDDVIKGAQAKLLTFKNLASSADVMGGSFDKATMLSADMATVFGGDASSNAVLLGKALNDPIKGLASLGRVGIQFDADQKKLIETMVKGGDVAGAQAIILKELETQVGGTAAASATSADIIKARWDDAVQNLGTALLPVFEQIAGYVSDTFLPAMEGAADGVKGLFGWFGENQAWLVPVISGIGGAILVALVPALIAATTAVAAFTVALLANPLTWIAIAVGVLIAAVVALAMNWDTVVKVVSDIWAGFVGWITDGLNGLASWWSGVWEGMIGFFKDTWKNIQDFGKTALDFLIKLFLDWHPLGVIIKNWEPIMKFFGDLGAKFVQFGKDILDGLLNGMQDAWNAVIDWVSGAAENIAGAFKDILGIKSPSKVFTVFGENIGEGLVNGLEAQENAVKNAAEGLAIAAGSAFSATMGQLQTAMDTDTEVFIKQLTALGQVGTLSGNKNFVATGAGTMATLLQQGGVSNVNGVTMADIMAASRADALSSEKASKAGTAATKKGKEAPGFIANPLLTELLKKAGYDFKNEWSKQLVSQYTNDLLNKLQGGYTLSNGGMNVGSVTGAPNEPMTVEYFQSQVAPLLKTGYKVVSGASNMPDLSKVTSGLESQISAMQQQIAYLPATETAAKANLTEIIAGLKSDLAAVPKLARGGFVNKPTRAIIGEAGPEVVTPLKDFERMMGIGNFERGQQKVLHYHAAPDKSIDREEALFKAIRRAKVVAAW